MSTTTICPHCQAEGGLCNIHSEMEYDNDMEAFAIQHEEDIIRFSEDMWEDDSYFEEDEDY